MTDYGFVRISTGSQDAQTQERDILKAYPDAVIVRTDTKAASASKGEHLDALDRVIAELREGDRVIVTDSSRLDRRDNGWDQIRTTLDIRDTGATVVSLAPGEERFGEDVEDTVRTQRINATKSRTVKTQTRRGMTQVQANRAHFGALPMLWETTGERYRKQAHCTDPDGVRDIYSRVAGGESLQSVANAYGCWPSSVKSLIRFAANHTGVITCSWSGLAWVHQVAPVVESPLWWRANKVLDANATKDRANLGGRPVAQTANWLSGLLPCPGCGGRLYVNAGHTPAGNPRTPKLRCGGHLKQRRSCGQYRGVAVALVIEQLDRMFCGDDTEILSFQRVSGNAHELDEMKADLARLQARLSATEDDDELDALVASRKALRAQISAFQLVPDSFDYAPTGQTVAGMWAGSDEGKRRIVKAVMPSIWRGHVAPSERVSDGIVDLGEGVCFRVM